MVIEQALTAILRMEVRGAKEVPSTPEGKFLALMLCLRAESMGAVLPDKSNLFSDIPISQRLGDRAYQDLMQCQWIQGRCFYPNINEGRRASEYIGVIRCLLSESPTRAQAWLGRHLRTGLSVKNRLLLLILLDRASFTGRVGPISFGTLSKLTGFTLNQTKVQLQKLKEMGLVSGVVPGVTGATLFGVAKSYIYLNLLHPYWSDFFPGWRAVCLDASLCCGILSDEGESLHRLMGASRYAELVKRPELQRYFHNLMLMLISGVLSRDWHDLRLENWTGILQMRRLLGDKRLRARLPASFDDLFPRFARIANQLQIGLCNGDKDLMTRIGLDSSGPWCFCVLPQFGDQSRPIVILTNCPLLSSEIDASWLRRADHDLWVAKGLVTSPDDAPLKIRSRKPKAI